MHRRRWGGAALVDTEAYGCHPLTFWRRFLKSTFLQLFPFFSPEAPLRTLRNGPNICTWISWGIKPFLKFKRHTSTQKLNRWTGLGRKGSLQRGTTNSLKALAFQVMVAMILLVSASKTKKCQTSTCLIFFSYIRLCRFKTKTLCTHKGRNMLILYIVVKCIKAFVCMVLPAVVGRTRLSMLTWWSVEGAVWLAVAVLPYFHAMSKWPRYNNTSTKQNKT